MVAVLLAQSAATAQEAIQFFDELFERCVGVFAGDAGNQIGAANLDVPLGDKLPSDAAGLITFEVNPNVDYLVIAAEETSGFFGDDRVQRVGEFQMNAADNELSGDILGRDGVSHAPG